MGSSSPLYFPPLKVMGNPEAPPAKSLIIRSTPSGSLPPLGLVQSTVFRIMWPTYTHANSNCKSVVGKLPAAPSRTWLYLCTQQWCTCPFLGGHRPSGSWIWDAHQSGTLQTVSTPCLYVFSSDFGQLEILTATAAYTFPDTKGNHVDVGKLYLALFQVPWKQKRGE